eukprot:gnl/TRDRNA2_/TRDRNA2_115083_c2_seq1.p1 gnl/TRDRNA2_/TRDRNA2_115083_c2~~gnl/TRDRNA2_/TRDRNA2_115083_c2_seq1.p1  ORF type:complete len:363 (+),score=58.41 gnl/TRDRNA2_/TRDRNA2_115083_c2_seq1:2-1090(+)
MYMPLAWKASNCHDVVLLCPRCRSRVEQKQVERAAKLLGKFGARVLPTTGTCANERKLSSAENTVVAHSRALLKHRRAAAGQGCSRHKLPPWKVAEFEATVYEFRNRTTGEGHDPDAPLTDADIEACTQLNAGPPPAQLVVEALLQEGDAALLEWVGAWRQLFLDTVQPQCLPESWSVDFDVAATASMLGATPSEHAVRNGASLRSAACVNGSHEALLHATIKLPSTSQMATSMMQAHKQYDNAAPTRGDGRNVANHIWGHRKNALFAALLKSTMEDLDRAKAQQLEVSEELKNQAEQSVHFVVSMSSPRDLEQEVDYCQATQQDDITTVKIVLSKTSKYTGVWEWLLMCTRVQGGREVIDG